MVVLSALRLLNTTAPPSTWPQWMELALHVLDSSMTRFDTQNGSKGQVWLLNVGLFWSQCGVKYKNRGYFGHKWAITSIKKSQNVSKRQFWYVRRGAGMVSMRGQNGSEGYFSHKWAISSIKNNQNVSKGQFWFLRSGAVMVSMWGQNGSKDHFCDKWANCLFAKEP